MKAVRFEVNLDVRDDVDLEELRQRIAWTLNVYGVERVQSVLIVAPKK